MKTLFGLIAVLVFNVAANAQTFQEPRTVKINDRVFALLGPIQLPIRTIRAT